MNEAFINLKDSAQLGQESLFVDDTFDNIQDRSKLGIPALNLSFLNNNEKQ